MLAFIDRFEGDFAVLYVGDTRYDVPKALFEGAVEGDKVEIKVIGKNADTENSAHTLFERLRKQSRDRH